MPAFIAFVQALPAFIQALSDFFKIMLKLMDLVDRFVSWSKKNKLEDFFHELEKSMDSLERADTPAKKLAAARSALNIVRALE
jgi:molecular chaperone GrpE (heat shock protein)